MNSVDFRRNNFLSCFFSWFRDFYFENARSLSLGSVKMPKSFSFDFDFYVDFPSLLLFPWKQSVLSNPLLYTSQLINLFFIFISVFCLFILVLLPFFTEVLVDSRKFLQLTTPPFSFCLDLCCLDFDFVKM